MTGCPWTAHRLCHHRTHWGRVPQSPRLHTGTGPCPVGNRAAQRGVGGERRGITRICSRSQHRPHRLSSAADIRCSWEPRSLGPQRLGPAALESSVTALHFSNTFLPENCHFLDCLTPLLLSPAALGKWPSDSGSFPVVCASRKCPARLPARAWSPGRGRS